MTSWEVKRDRGVLLVGTFRPENARQPEHKKVAAFDLDSTLIETKSGHTHADHAGDWKLWNPCVPIKLRELRHDGYHIVILTNQGSFTSNITSKEGEDNTFNKGRVVLFKEKVESVFETELKDVPLTIYVACANDIYRKPRTGMWEEMVKDVGPGFDKKHSFFVGDAAGRLADVENPKIEKDWTDADFHLAENLELTFYTPDQFFLEKDERVPGHQFDPQKYLKSEDQSSTDPMIKPETSELLLLVGLPGAGKTTYYKDVVEPLGYERIDPRSAENLEVCRAAADELLKEGKSVVIDHVNEDVEARKPWLALASELKVPARALFFLSEARLCHHNDAFRALSNREGFEEKRKIFKRKDFKALEPKLQPPDVSEGFVEVLVIPFKWRGKSDELELWKRHWAAN